MKEPTNRRRQLIVDQAEQHRMMLNIALWPSLILLATAIGFSWTFREVEQTLEIADARAPWILAAFLGATCFLFAAIATILWLALKTSHRFYGPAYRIHKCLDAFAAGETNVRIRLRNGDHLTALAQRVNGFLDQIQTSEEERAAPSEASHALLDSLPSANAGRAVTTVGRPTD